MQVDHDRLIFLAYHQRSSSIPMNHQCGIGYLIFKGNLIDNLRVIPCFYDHSNLRYALWISPARSNNSALKPVIIMAGTFF